MILPRQADDATLMRIYKDALTHTLDAAVRAVYEQGLHDGLDAATARLPIAAAAPAASAAPLTAPTKTTSTQ